MAKKELNLQSSTSLTMRQTEILQFIKSFIETNGYPPSVREIGKAIGLSSSASIHTHLQKLENAGYLQRNQSKSRAIELTEETSFRQQKMLPIPLLGKVTAGQPILAQENIEATFPLPAQFIGANTHDDLFMLNVSGDSMINAGILDGDIVLVRKQQTANNGDIVVAFLPEEETSTIKRFFKESNKIRLQPENDKLTPVFSNQVLILGKVIGVFRFL